MCKLMEDLQEEGRAEGRTEGRIEGKKETLLANIRNAMESWGLTAEDAMKGLKVSVDEQKILLPLI